MRVAFFALLLSLGLSSCGAQKAGADFYEGLKKRHVPAEAAAFFEKALDYENSSASAAAAAELMSLHSAGAELSPSLIINIRKKAAGSWSGAFAAMESREKTLALLLSGEGRAAVDEAALYALKQWRSAPVADNSFTNAENALVDGRIAASRSRYNEALLFFRIVLNDAPELFFQYPDLLVDLGRAFQYTETGREGIELFLNWEAVLDAETVSPTAALLRAAFKKLIPAGSENLIRFRLLFFAARTARQRGENSIELFEKAFAFAREISPEQADACIWYILDSSLANPGRAIRYLETYSSQWHDDAYFFDVLDKLARELMLRRQWENIASVFEMLRNRNGAAAAKYAWTIGRLIEERVFSPEESSDAYMRAAYNAGGASGGIGGYYRSLAALATGESFITLEEAPPPKTAATSKPSGDSDAMRFLLGFFENNAAEFAPRYIRATENDLSAEELYRLAEALSAAGQYQESIRLVSLYINRNGYQVKRGDLELLYPRPFRELVEQYAAETGIEAAVLYGLIRTESAFNSDAVSRAGAVGLSQLMPATAEEAAGRLRRQGGPDYTGAVNLNDPAINIHIGAVYLAYLNERMEDNLLALLAYNGGMNRIRRWRATVNRSAGNMPPDLFLEMAEYAETRNYGRSVLSAAAMYKELYDMQ